VRARARAYSVCANMRACVLKEFVIQHNFYIVLLYI